MNKMRHPVLIPLLLLCCTICTGTAKTEDTALLILRHSRSTGLHYAYLQVANKYLGRIYSGQSIRVRVVCGRSTTIVFYRQNRISKKTINPSPGDTRTIILDFRNNRGYLLISIPAHGRLNRVRVIINGRKRGFLKKGKQRIFQLQAGTATVILKQPGILLRKQLLIQPGTTNAYTPFSKRK